MKQKETNICCKTKNVVNSSNTLHIFSGCVECLIPPSMIQGYIEILTESPFVITTLSHSNNYFTTKYVFKQPKNRV